MVKKRFNRVRSWPFKKVKRPCGNGWRRRWMFERRDNDEIFTTWLVHKLRQLGGRNLADGERLNALSLSMNSKNLDYLSAHIGPEVYLAYAPREDNSLKDGELGVDMDKIYVKEGK